MITYGRLHDGGIVLHSFEFDHQLYKIFLSNEIILAAYAVNLWDMSTNQILIDLVPLGLINDDSSPARTSLFR